MSNGDSFSSAFDQAAQPPPQAATVAPQTQPNAAATPPPSGDAFNDAFNQAEAPTKQTGSIAEAHKSWWDWAGKSLLDDVSGGFVSKQLAHENQIGQQIINHEISQAHPWRAALAQFYYGSLKDAANVGMQLTTPANVALAVTGASRIRALRALVSLPANLYFAYRGGQELFQERQANETQADALQRRLLGAAGLTGGLGGAGGTVEDIAATTKAQTLDKLGLSGNLQAKVQAKLDQVHAIRQRAALENAQQTSDVLDAQQQIQGQAPVRMGQVLRDAAHAVESEYARVSKPFEEMASQAEKPVSDAASIRATILDVIKGHGVQDQEIPPKIFNALPKRGVGGQVFLDIPKGPASLQVPELAEGFEAATKPVSFKDLTRVRSDLWDAAQGSKDGTVKAAMFDAYDSMTQMQEDYAAKNGFGEKYQAAKEDYKQFKRELGSGLMSDFLRAEDFKQQAMAPRIAKLMTGSDAEAIRGLLKIAGVDTTPIDELLSGKSVKGAVEAVGKAGEKKVAATGKVAEQQIRVLGKQEPIIPGRSDLALAGKSTEEIRSDAIKKLANDMRQQGMSNPMGWFMTILGTLRMAAGSQFGAFQLARGASSLSRGRLLRNPSFQDWVIRESGVDPSNLTLIQKLRRGMDRSGAIARVAVQQGQRAQDQTGTSP